MPIYFALHLWASPIPRTATSKDVARDISMDPRDLALLPISLTLGFIIPTALAAIPPPILTTVAQQQAFLILWQGFPLWIAICQYSLTTIISSLPSRSTSGLSSRTLKLKSLRRAHAFSVSVAAFAHLITILFAAVPHVRSIFFVSDSRREISIQSVFLPMSPFSSAKVDSIYQGCRILLQYDMYFACSAAIIWASVVTKHAFRDSTLHRIVMKVFLLVCLAGPGGAALAMVWGVDEEIFGTGSKITCIDKTEKDE
jgi:hypothetical protein